MNRSRMNQDAFLGQAIDRRKSCRSISGGSDRRGTCRYRPIESGAALSWTEKKTRVEIQVELDNISVQGCMVRSNARVGPRAGEPIWFRAVGIQSLGWIEGRVIAIEKPFLRRYEVRIVFVSTLPFHAFKKVVYGEEDTSPPVVERPAYETDQWWR